MSMALMDRPGTREPTMPGGAGSTQVWSLVDQAKSGDRHAFATLYQLHYGEVFRYVFARTGNRHLAEDITSETALRALSKINSLTHRGSTFRAWLMTIARNIIFDESRCARGKLEVEFPEHYEVVAEDVDPASAVCRSMMADELWRSLRELSTDQRACLELRFFHGLSLSEVARHMNRRPNAVSAIQVRALRRLSELTSAHWLALAS